ncbi:MAG TPA: sodium:calcium antiporter, partial [Pirellulaceae bacterium]|nr:sodium:calcium antiporter [Pirellulaceae bacterium]
FTLLVGYSWWLIRQCRKEPPAATDSPVETAVLRPWYHHLALIVFGLVLLVFGARFLVSGAVDIARMLGATELIIGLTIVAAGTSLPEVITSVVASIRGQRDIAVGNIVGSNIFNLLCVMGLAASVSPQAIPISEQALWFDFPVMIAVSLVCLPIFFDGVIARWEGFLFLAYYVAYVTYLILDQTGSVWRADFSHAMLYFCIPLTLLTLLVLAFRKLPDRATP